MSSEIEGLKKAQELCVKRLAEYKSNEVECEKSGFLNSAQLWSTYSVGIKACIVDIQDAIRKQE